MMRARIKIAGLITSKLNIKAKNVEIGPDGFPIYSTTEKQIGLINNPIFETEGFNESIEMFVSRLERVWPMFGYDRFNSRHTPFDTSHTEGKLRWKFQAGGKVLAPPTVGADGLIFFPAYDGYLYCLAPDGSLVWKFQMSSQSISPPAITDDGTVFVGDANKLWAVTPDGTEKWSVNLPAPQYPITVLEDGILVVTNEPALYKFDFNGNQIWSYTAPSGSPNPVFGPPAVGHDGSIYVALYNSSVVKLDSNGNLIGAFGDKVRSYPVVDRDGNILVGYFHSKQAGNKVILSMIMAKYSPDGTKIKEFATGCSLGNWGGCYSTIALSKNNEIVFVTRSPGLSAGRYPIKIFNFTNDLDLLWGYNTVLGDLPYPATDINGNIYFASAISGTDVGGTKYGLIFALGPTGDVKWTHYTDEPLRNALVVNADGTIYVGDFVGYLHAVR